MSPHFHFFPSPSTTLEEISILLASATRKFSNRNEEGHIFKCEYKLKGFIQKKYLLEKFLFTSKSDLCEFINHLMFLHTTHFAGIKWNWFSIFENIHLRYLLTKQNQNCFVQYLPPLPPDLQKISVIVDHIVSEGHVEDHRRQHRAHHDHCHHVCGQEGGTWGSGSYFICLLLPPLRVGRGKGGVLSLFPNIFPHIAE